jgi:hypothetical protein
LILEPHPKTQVLYSHTAISGTTHTKRNKIYIHTFQDVQALHTLISSGCWIDGCVSGSIYWAQSFFFFIFSKCISYMYHTYQFSDHTSCFCNHNHVHTAGIINMLLQPKLWLWKPSDALWTTNILNQFDSSYQSKYTCRKCNYPNMSTHPEFFFFVVCNSDIFHLLLVPCWSKTKATHNACLSIISSLNSLMKLVNLFLSTPIKAMNGEEEGYAELNVSPLHASDLIHATSTFSFRPS